MNISLDFTRNGQQTLHISYGSPNSDLVIEKIRRDIVEGKARGDMVTPQVQAESMEDQISTMEIILAEMKAD